MPRKIAAAQDPRVFLNAGSGPKENKRLPLLFRKWKQVRVDIDPATKPDVVSSVTDLCAIPRGSVDAVWSSHCIEHLYPHQVPFALSEFRRVLSRSGFACIVVPDLQAVSEWIANDRLDEIIYQSPSGPVTAHDMIWGFAPALASNNLAMAHHCGFTPTLLMRTLTGAGFENVLLRRKSTLELVALALRQHSRKARRCEEILSELGF